MSNAPTPAATPTEEKAAVFTITSHPLRPGLAVVDSRSYRIASISDAAFEASHLTRREITDAFTECAKKTGHASPREQACLRTAVAAKLNLDIG